MIHIYDANAYLRQSLNRHDFFKAQAVSPRLVYEAANAAPVPQIWVWDGPGNNDRRRAIFPGYKIRDYTGQEDIFAGLQVYRELLAHSTALQIEVPGWEADDVCATIARRAGQPVTIHTNDFDYHQLGTNPNITIKGMRPIEGVPPQYVSLYKAFRGDPSDKIPGIVGFGPKSWDAFRELWPILDKACRERDAETIRAQPFNTKPKLWLSSDENMELLFAYYAITQFYDVPIEEIDRHTKPGQFNPEAAQQLFSRFML